VLSARNVDEGTTDRKIPPSPTSHQGDDEGRKAGDVHRPTGHRPYDRSFRPSSTHVLAPKLDEAANPAALKAGHAYVAHY